MLNQLRTKIFAAIISCITIAPMLNAQDTSIKLRYDFEGVVDRTVPDNSGNGNTATLVSNATVIPMGKYHVLKLGIDSGYLDMGKQAGATLAGMSNYTVSVYCHVSPNASLSGNGYFLWAFSTLPYNTQTKGIYSAYRLNEQRYEFTMAGYANEAFIQKSIAAQKGAWIHIAYSQNGTTGTLYIDGQVIGTNTITQPSTGFSELPIYNWIGRAPFRGDNYLKNTLVYDFCLYNKALSTTEITTLAARRDLLQQALTADSSDSLKEFNTKQTKP